MIDHVNFKKAPYAVQRAFMIHQRYCYAYATLLNGKYIAVAGGALDNLHHTDKCEYYDIPNDIWYPLPQLNEQRFQASLVNVNDKYLYCLGGAKDINQVNGLIRTVERINFVRLNAQRMMYFSSNYHGTLDGFSDSL